MNKKLMPLTFIAAAGLLALTACGGSQHAEAGASTGTSDSKKIVFGVSNGYPPMEYTDPTTGKFTGFDVDLGEAIGKKLGKSVEWQEMEFDQLINSLRTSRIDATMSGMSDTPERQKSIDFVDYITDGPQFFTAATHSAGVKAPKDLCGKSVGTVSGTTYVEKLAQWSKENCDAGAQINVLRISEASDVLLQLRQERIAGAMLGTVSLAHHTAITPNTYTLLGEPVSQDRYGIGVQKGKEDLLNDVQKAVKDLKADGTYDKLLEKYGLGKYGVDEVTINLGQ